MIQKWFSAIVNIWFFHETLWMATPWWPSDSLRTKQKGLLRILAVSNAEKIDMEPLVENLASENRGRYRRILKRLLVRLRAGVPVLAALEQIPDSINENDLLALRIGANTGSLNAMYRELLQTENSLDKSIDKPRVSISFYANSLAIIYLLIMSFVVTFLIPVIREIQMEFGADTEGLSYFLVGFLNDWFGTLYPLVILLLILVGLLNWFSRSRRFFRRLARNFSVGIPLGIQSQFLEVLAVVVNSGRPPETAIAAFAESHFDRRTRLKMQAIESELEGNQNIWDMLLQCDMINVAEAKALQQVSDPKSLCWCLREFANRRKDRTQIKNHIRSHLMHPLVTLLFAFLVLMVSVAMISFLSELAHTLADVV